VISRGASAMALQAMTKRTKVIVLKTENRNELDEGGWLDMVDMIPQLMDAEMDPLIATDHGFEHP
jgi:hypothetical protein